MHRRVLLLMFGRFAALTACYLAPALRAQTAEPQLLPGDVDVQSSRIFVFVGKTGFGHDHGVAGRLKSGRVQLGRERDAGELVFDMTSWDADGTEARKYVGLKGETDDATRRQVNENMHAAAILNTAKFPTATFQIDSALPIPPEPGTSGSRYQFKGAFTLVGVSRPMQLTCEVVPRGRLLQLRTGFVLTQTAHGIKPFSKALGAVGVADQLKVFGEVFVAGGDR